MKRVSSASLPVPNVSRRFVVATMGGAALSVSARMLARVAFQPPTKPPAQVAGIPLPDSALASAAVNLARSACPAFLFNHCMRTYLFGALLAERDSVPYDREMIFIAASLHDLGLTRRYASPRQPFEMDGADAAREFLLSRGVSEGRAELVWNAVAMHASVLVDHQPPQVALVGDGAGADVFGSELSTLPPERVRAVLAAFPRLSFNTEFRDLLIDHCHRKPFAQHGTWLEGFCRQHNPAVQYPDLEARLLHARVGE